MTSTPRREWVRRRDLYVSELVATHLREGIIDPENGYEIGTAKWFATQVVKKFGDEVFPDGTPVLPKAYLAGGDIAGMAFSQDLYKIRQRTGTEIAKNLEAIRNYKTHELEYLNDLLMQSILEKGVDKSLGALEQYLKVNEQIFKLNGLNAPTKNLNANLNVDMSKLSRSQLDRIAAGESLEMVLAHQDEDTEDNEEVLEGEYAEA